MSIERGARIGVDVGSVRIGVSRSDPDGIMAVPHATVPAGEDAVADLLICVAEFDPQVFYVGNPLSLSGEQTMSTQKAQEFAVLLSSSTDVPVYLVDERLSTKSAAQQLRSAGRNAKNSKEIIDQAAAVVILESALEIEKRLMDRAGLHINP